jgi:UDP-N-acetylglucosamine 2-epimerase
MDELGVRLGSNIAVIEPLGYVDMVALVSSARRVLTDSGGLQKEAYWLAVPCVTLREETEWVETVAAGWNALAGFATESIVSAVRTLEPPQARPDLYGGSSIAAKCVDLLG